MREQRRSEFRRFAKQLALACLATTGVGIAAGVWVHQALALVVPVLAWLLYVSVVRWARCRACGRFLAQAPGRFARMETHSVPQRRPHCGTAVP